MIPKYLIRLLPPLAFHNRLPYAIEIKVPLIKYEVRIEAGEKASIYFLNLLRTHKISIHVSKICINRLFLYLPCTQNLDQTLTF